MLNDAPGLKCIFIVVGYKDLRRINVQTKLDVSIKLINKLFLMIWFNKL